MAKVNGQRSVSKENKQEVELEKYIRTIRTGCGQRS